MELGIFIFAVIKVVLKLSSVMVVYFAIDKIYNFVKRQKEISKIRSVR